MGTVAVAIICKTPIPGKSKTRLSPPLRPAECAAISACFIQDLASTIGGLDPATAAGYAVYTPEGSEAALRRLLPGKFGLVLQGEGDLGDRLHKGITDLLAAGHPGAILVNSDSPTLPPAILQAAVDATAAGDRVVLCPAVDGGYTLIGLSQAHRHLFDDIPWSTDVVFRLTLERAKEMDLPVVVLDPWYDIDDASSYATLEAEMAGERPAFANPATPPQDAPATRRFLAHRRATLSDVSIVIPCLNEEEPIAEVVREVLAQGVGEVIVVDNGSTDRTAELAAAAGARVVSQPVRGYGRACASGVAAANGDIICFMDGDGSDVPDFIAGVVGPIADGTADFVMGSRIRGKREPGSMTPQQVLAGKLAGALLRATYGVRFTDMSPLRAMRADRLAALGMREETYGWNLEMQMRVAAGGLRCLEIPVDHRCRRGGESKVSGNLVAGMKAGCKITTTFLRLALALRKS